MIFTRYKNNPIISPSKRKAYENKAAFNPTATAHNNKVYLFYRAEGKNGVSSLCLAISNDGYNFQKHQDNPIIKPTLPEEKGGCEDPRITKIGDTFYLLYTSYNGQQPVTAKTINESLATSKDMLHWKKQGILIKGLKSAIILPEKINSQYFMFIGGENIKIATSKDLTHWEIDSQPILSIREDKFDNRYVEVGPLPFIYQNKIVFFFNVADKKGTFYTSLAFLDKNNPRKVLYRADKPILTPTKPYEKHGNVKNIIFGTGLVEFKGKYFYYYGSADTTISVATVSKKKMESYLSSLL